MEKIAKNITEFFIANKMISVNKKEWCIYVLQKKFLSLASTILIIIISVFNRYVIETVSFSIAFITLRKKSGGIHMNNPGLCIFASSVMVGTLPLVINWMELYENIIIISLIVSIYIITKFSPINHPNIHFNRDEILANRRKVKIICKCIIVSYVVFYIINVNTIANCISLAAIYDAIGMLLSKLLLQEVKNEY